MANFFRDEGISINGRLICLATTAYDCPDAGYTYSIQASRMALHQAGYGTSYYLLQGNCHVDDARNRVVQAFLASPATDLVFLDSDVSWEPHQLVQLCNHDCDIVGGVYPYRDERRQTEMPVRMKVGAALKDGLLEVEGLPTGFMRIRRHVLEKVRDVSRSFPTPEGDTHLIFERVLEGETRWGGDLNFCNKWRAMGGEIYADYEMHLGHTVKTILRDSLGAVARRAAGLTLKHVCEKIQAGTETVMDLDEARRSIDNRWGASNDVLSIAVKMARTATGPILEAGSGLSTVLMAAATKETVFCLEHHPLYIAKLRDMAHAAGVGNIGVCAVPLVGGWYDTSAFRGLPERFSFGLCDGPPREYGDRMRFLEMPVDTILCDDADNPEYRQQLIAWAESHGEQIHFVEPRAAILKWQPHATSLAAACV